MATMRESTGLLMAAAEGSVSLSVPVHAWSISAPLTDQEVKQEKRRKQVMLVGLGTVLTIAVVALAFLIFHPKSFLHHRRHLFEVERKGSSAYWMQHGAVFEDALDEFSPTVDMEVHYSGGRAMDGTRVPVSDLAISPVVGVRGNNSDLYTLLMIDLDVPESHKDRKPSTLMWNVMNIPGGGSARDGWEVVSYKPPSFIQEGQKLLLVLFKQPTILNEPVSGHRIGFHTKKFALYMGFGEPAAAVYIVASQDEDE